LTCTPASRTATASNPPTRIKIFFFIFYTSFYFGLDQCFDWSASNLRQ
jgi:hypothetical protein